MNTPSIYDPESSVESQIYFIKHFESGFDRETGLNDKLVKILEQMEQMEQIDDAIKHVRDIFRGRGLRELSYSLLFTLNKYHPDNSISILKSFVSSIGCWKDVRNYANYCRKYNANAKTIEAIICIYNDEFRKNTGSYAAKYVPRESKDPEFFEILVGNWFHIAPTGITSWHRMTYRKMVSALAANIPISYNDDETLYMKSPWKIIKCALIADRNNDVVAIDEMNAHWSNYIMNGTMENYIPILDLSPNMHFNHKDLCVGIASALFLASKSLFGNKILTYSQKVVWIDLENIPLNIALQRILGVTMNIQGCVCCVMSLIFDALKSSEIIEDDLEKVKIKLITNSELDISTYAKIQKSWLPIGKLDGRNFEKIAVYAN